MPEKDDKAGKVEKAEIVFRVIFPAHNDAAIIVKPREEALHFPALLISTKHASVLRLGLRAPTASMGCDDFGAVLRKNLLVQSVTVVRLVADDPLGQVRHKALIDGLAD